MTDANPPPHGTDAAKGKLLKAALPNVTFDGWTNTTLEAAITESGVDAVLARALFPRGGVDMALAYHYQNDARVAAQLAKADLSHMRFRDRITHAVRLRLDAPDDREAIRRATTLFATPIYANDGIRALWATSDMIWNALGDESRDVNWYTKRSTLSAVYSSTLLYWLGDESPDHMATWAFLDRRIEGVMQIEKAKAKLRANPLARAICAGPMQLIGKITAPVHAKDMPGSLTTPYDAPHS